jgi:hypothetical protein
MELFETRDHLGLVDGAAGHGDGAVLDAFATELVRALAPLALPCGLGLLGAISLALTVCWASCRHVTSAAPAPTGPGAEPVLV